MGAIKGQNEFAKFLVGKDLTRKQAILAKCYECNGLEDSRCDCGVDSCPLYGYRPYKSK